MRTWGEISGREKGDGSEDYMEEVEMEMEMAEEIIRVKSGGDRKSVV